MESPEHALPPASPRTDFIAAWALVAFGAVVAWLSWRMDRLGEQDGTLWTAPGLWPGLVGACLVGLGLVVVVRSRRRAREIGWDAVEQDDTPLVPTSRFTLAAGLFFAYGLVLVGRGLPFWLGTTLFVATYVFLFREAPPGASAARRVLVALAIGGATAAVVTLVFERVFLVRLP